VPDGNMVSILSFLHSLSSLAQKFGLLYDSLVTIILKTKISASFGFTCCKFNVKVAECEPICPDSAYPYSLHF